MWPRYLLLTVVLTCFCYFIHAQQPGYLPMEKRVGAKYCGSLLSNMLAAVCQGKYNTKAKKAVYDSDSEEDYEYQQPYFEEQHYKFPFMARPNAASLISGSFKRYTRGVYDECCKKACTMAELRTYCEV